MADGYDIIVIGAGHAGVEAALAAARLHHSVLLLTLSADSISFMACNPNIGGTAKGHLVREIDALGGQMSICADKALIQLRMLGQGKGAAVYSLRGQTDKALYHRLMKQVLETTPGITLLQGEAKQIIFDGDTAVGIVTAVGQRFFARAIVICAGVYSDSRIIIGEYTKAVGPNGFENAIGLTECLRSQGIELVRFKTGTPPRILGSSIDFSVMEEQRGDEDIYTFSTVSEDIEYNKRSCYLTYTNAETHRIIRENISRAPLFNGSIHGVGPRYCPSIEDKIMRFADKERHQIFIEPEGLDTEEYYVQGLSSSMPYDVQLQMLHSIRGLESAKIIRYAYAIEYDCLNPLELLPTLMLKKAKGLFSAGQMNGSSGYEEAAAQGLMAGINAVRYIEGLDGVVLGREQAYIGVLIDDLVTKGTPEPYRMMTARAEYRLSLRQDNADVRLCEIGHSIGLLDDARYNKYLEKQAQTQLLRERLSEHVGQRVYAPLLDEAGEAYSGAGMSYAEILKRNNVTVRAFLAHFPQFADFGTYYIECVQTELRYEGYIKKQESTIQEAKRLTERVIPDDIDYMSISGIRIEARQKLERIRPQNVGQASRISGVNPSDITVLLLYLNTKGKV